jgi:hypothetical protein
MLQCGQHWRNETNSDHNGLNACGPITPVLCGPPALARRKSCWIEKSNVMSAVAVLTQNSKLVRAALRSLERSVEVSRALVCFFTVVRHRWRMLGRCGPLWHRVIAALQSRSSPSLLSGGPFGWLHPFAILTGIGLILGYALLGAGWLVRHTGRSLWECRVSWRRPQPPGRTRPRQSQ